MRKRCFEKTEFVQKAAKSDAKVFTNHYQTFFLFLFPLLYIYIYIYYIADVHPVGKRFEEAEFLEKPAAEVDAVDERFEEAEFFEKSVADIDLVEKRSAEAELFKTELQSLMRF